MTLLQGVDRYGVDFIVYALHAERSSLLEDSEHTEPIVSDHPVAPSASAPAVAPAIPPDNTPLPTVLHTMRKTAVERHH